MITEFQGKHRFLSNFFPCHVAYQGITYPSLEHAYQAQKSSSQEERMLIASLASPGKAKLHETQHPVPSWSTKKTEVMRELVAIKFSELNVELVQQLVETWPQELQEGNTWGDYFWGVCPPGSGKGDNYLGRLLMNRRELLRC